MKKIFFLTALLCASMMSWASTQYCGETSPNANFTFSLTHVSSNVYKIQFDAIGDDHFSGTINNINCGVNQTNGAGIFFGGDNAKNWVITEDRAYLEFETASESSVPTSFYANFFAFAKVGGGEIIINNFNPSDVDWTATCGAAAKTDPALTINKTEVTLSAEAPAETFQIVATKAAGAGAISYESSNAGIAAVDNDGLVTAVGRGKATITVRVAENETFAAASKKLTVTVTGPINWDAIEALSGSKYKVLVEPEIASTFGGMHIEDGTKLWVGFPSAEFGACSIEMSTNEGAWRTFALSQFPYKYNIFTVVCGGTTYTFHVCYEDGTTTSIDNIEAGEKAMKVIENGQLIIIKNGVRYNALGAQIQ